jgi:signal transduction histidine kinase
MSVVDELARVARYESLVDLAQALSRQSDIASVAQTFDSKLKYVSDARSWRYIGWAYESGAGPADIQNVLSLDGQGGKAFELEVSFDTLTDFERLLLDRPIVQLLDGEERRDALRALRHEDTGEGVGQVYVCPQVHGGARPSALLYVTKEDRFASLDLKFLTLASHLFSEKLRHVQVERRLVIALQEKLTNVEQIREIENRLRTQERMASLGKLVAGVSHELNTPLGVIASSLQTVASAARKLQAKVAEAVSDDSYNAAGLNAIFTVLASSVSAVGQAAERIDSLAKSLKNFARLDESKYQIADLHDGIESILTLLKSKTGSHIRVVKSYGGSVALYCAPAQLNQAFMHLIRNAVEAIPEEGEIEIRTHARDGEVTIEIRDTGVGMAPETLAGVFDFNFSRDSRVKMGFGLFLTKKIVEEHGGTVEITSDQGKGTAATVRLPIEHDHYPGRASG